VQAKGIPRETVNRRSILESHLSYSQSSKLEEMSKMIREQKVPFGKGVDDELFALYSLEKTGLEQEQKNEIKRLIGWVCTLENEVCKYKILPDVSDNEKIHNAKYDFKRLERHAQSKMGWIRAFLFTRPGPEAVQDHRSKLSFFN